MTTIGAGLPIPARGWIDRYDIEFHEPSNHQTTAPVAWWSLRPWNSDSQRYFLSSCSRCTSKWLCPGTASTVLDSLEQFSLIDTELLSVSLVHSETWKGTNLEHCPRGFLPAHQNWRFCKSMEPTWLYYCVLYFIILLGHSQQTLRSSYRVPKMNEFVKFLAKWIGDMICARGFGKRIKAVSTKEWNRFVFSLSLHNGYRKGIIDLAAGDSICERSYGEGRT